MATNDRLTAPRIARLLNDFRLDWEDNNASGRACVFLLRSEGLSISHDGETWVLEADGPDADAEPLTTEADLRAALESVSR